MQQRHYNIPIFIPNAACPHQCIFCSQKKISGALRSPSADEIKITIEQYLSTIPKNSDIEIAFFGGTFTGLSVNEQEKYLQAVHGYIRNGSVKGIRISTRPDCITDEILTMLQEYNVITIELGAQSMNDNVLQLSERGHSPDDIITASKMISDSGISLGLQMMIGLPGDSLEKAIMTAEKIAALEPDTVRVYPALVIKDTELEKLYLEKKYTPLSLDNAVQWSAFVLQIFEEHGINVIRMGLHPIEGLLSGESLVAGPFHPSFRELVLTEMWRKALERFLFIPEKEELILNVHPDEYNYAIGYEASNKKMLANKFKTVRFKKDVTIKKGRNYGAIYN
jgi:histone acetyltransferase (RNA polymerase elongator complex component)